MQPRFRKLLPATERKYEAEESSLVLPPPEGYKRATDSHRCSGTHCKAMVSSSCKFCPECATPNAHYNSVANAVSKGSRSQGYKRQCDQLVDMQDALDFNPSKKQNLTKIWGDMLSKVRHSAQDAQGAADSAEAPTAELPKPLPDSTGLQTEKAETKPAVEEPCPPETS